MTEPIISVGVLNSDSIEFDLDGDFKAKGINQILDSLIEDGKIRKVALPRCFQGNYNCGYDFG